MDSLFDRAAKAAQFGVMVGLAITGPRFDSAEDEKTEHADVLAEYVALQNLQVYARDITDCSTVDVANGLHLARSR